jgi:DNA-directed RNA polymerase subunit RPC12/RpoP
MAIVENSGDGRDVRVACEACGAQTVRTFEWLTTYSRFACPTCSHAIVVSWAELNARRTAHGGAGHVLPVAA